MNPDGNAILVVDSVPEDRNRIAMQLADAGYPVVKASSETHALADGGENPSLVLMSLPGHDADGAAVCRRFDGTPVIFVLPREGEGMRSEVFAWGGADYLVKPVAGLELAARVRTQLALVEGRRQLTHAAGCLDRLAREKNRLLVYANRLAILGRYSAACTHDINNPVSAIMGNAELIKLVWKVALPIVQNHLDEDESGVLQRSAAKLDGKLDHILQGARRTSEAVKKFRDFARPGKVVRRDCRLRDILDDASSLLTHRLNRGHRLDLRVPGEVRVHGEAQPLCQAFVNLFDRAMTSREPEKGTITVEANRCNGRVRIRVRNDESGAETEPVPLAADPEFISPDSGFGNGLGLYIARHIIEQQNGELHVARAGSPGASLDVLLKPGDG